ncbi:site-specific integrase [Acidovorax sp.]|uniref:site-specific integrase n=1 Tax=Acidovorax sp. TaxID=1872122 RepID=UPI0025837556|nr:site-specific integrase [Acidovorax sp.]
MASIITRTRADGTQTYLVQIRIPGAKSVSKTFLNSVDAHQFALHEEARVRRDAAVFHAPDPLRFYKERFHDVLDLFAKESGVPQRTINNIPAVKKLIDRETRVGEMRPRWVEDYVKKGLRTLSSHKVPYSAASIAVHINIMRQAFIWRARRYDIEPTSIPFVMSYLPRGWDEGRTRRLAAHEEQALIAAMSKRHDGAQWKCLLTMALETAARQQELVLATWSEFNMKDEYWIIPKEHEKTRKERPVPLTKPAMNALRAMQLLCPGGPNDRVFAFTPNPASTSCAFAKLKTKAGLVDFRFHDLRHEGISRWVLYKRQYSLMEIMKIVGHSTPAMVARYANLRADELAAKMD